MNALEEIRAVLWLVEGVDPLPADVDPKIATEIARQMVLEEQDCACRAAYEQLVIRLRDPRR